MGPAGVTYRLRAVGESAGANGPPWLSWLPPIGWAELIRSFGSIRWWVLLLPLITAAVVVAVAAVLAARRGSDPGILPPRPGPPPGRGAPRGPFAPARRLHRGTLDRWVDGARI